MWNYSCKIQKLGTMLYYSGGDILYALSYALGQASKDTLTTPPTAHLLNKHVHSIAAEFISCCRDSPDVLACTNIDSIVTKVHPELWEFLSDTWTQTKSILNLLTRGLVGQ